MTHEEAEALLTAHEQEAVLRFWGRLDSDQQNDLLSQLAEIDLENVARLGSLVSGKGDAPEDTGIEPAPVVHLQDELLREARAHGASLIREGRVGVLIVAGGQGSRLGFEGPKGAFAIGPVSSATLFQIHAHKVLALERKYEAEVPLYIMTSQANDADTRQFFADHDNFGLSAKRLMFFTQGMWPALTESGKLILENPHQVFLSPDGHGGIVAAMRDRGVLADMRARDVTTVHYLQVDNPMVEIADPASVGYHDMQKADMTVKVARKRDADEPIGIIAYRGGTLTVVEYTELTPEQKNETLPDGSLRFLYGNLAIHVFSVDYLEQQAEVDLPVHVAHKKVPTCDEEGNAVKPESPNAYKFEKFIFDLIPRAERPIILAADREDEFSPVKNSEGEDSPDTSQRDMVRKHARWLEACGVSVPRTGTGDPTYQVEIDPLYALSETDLRMRLPSDFQITGDLYLA